MKRNLFVSAILSVSLSLSCLSLAFAQVTISDGDFNPANWQDIVYLSDNGTSLTRAIRVANGGNPGAHREMAFQWNTSGGVAAIYLYSRFLNATYNPSTQGAITSIDYSEDGRVTSDSIGTTNITLPARMGLEQGGIIYRTRVVSVVQEPPFPGDWTNLALSGLRAGNFIKTDDTVTGPDNPDFSASGGVINVGYIRANSTHVDVREIVTSIDNWTVTINQPSDAAYTISKVVLNDSGAGITTAEVGDNITYRVTLTNTGGVAIAGTEVIDTLPENLQYDSATATPANPGVAYDPGPPATVTWPVGSVAAGASARLDIDMEILAGADQQTLTNQATVSAIDAPAVAGQMASVDLAVHAEAADLDFVLVGSEDLGDVGGGVYMTRFTSTVRNNGPDAAEGTVVIYEYAYMLNSPEAVITGDPIGDLMVCEDRPVQRQYYCELPMPNTFDAGVTANLVVDYIRTGNPATPEVTMYATTYDPIPSNNNFTLPDPPPPDDGSGGGGSGCFIQALN